MFRLDIWSLFNSNLLGFRFDYKQISINFGWHANYWQVLGFCYLQETLHFCHPYKRLDTNLLTILSVKIWKWWSAKHQEQRMNSMCGPLPSKLFTHFTKWVQMSFNQSEIIIWSICIHWKRLPQRGNHIEKWQSLHALFPLLFWYDSKCVETCLDIVPPSDIIWQEV